MPIVAIGAALVALFASMLAYCLLTNTPCPVDGFDDAANESPQIRARYITTSISAVIALATISLFSALYTRKQWKRPGIATVATVLFAFIIAMLWGIAESGIEASGQILVFASIQFLVAGLIILDPIVSLVYFMATFLMFFKALEISEMLAEGTFGDLMYLATLDIVVCWVVYGLFVRSTHQQRSIADMSRRDELTGAKNRHYLRDDFQNHLGTDTFVMLCDIDDFKYYNDSYDHDTGDHLLKQFYYALREAFGDECTYRYGGDEFLIVSEEFGSAEFERRLEKVKKQLASIDVGTDEARLTYSGGFVHGVASDSESFRTMLHSADKNLLKAKQLGKNRIIG